MRWKEAEYSGWGRVLKAKGSLARPERVSEFDALIAENIAPAVGNLRSYGDAPLNDAGRAIVMSRLDRFIAFDPATGVLEAESGATIAAIMATFVLKGWMPIVVPGTAFATLGGCIANDVHGKNHHVAGTFGSCVESLVLTGADGKSRVVSTTKEAEIFTATIGGLGQTGIIRSARIRLARCPSSLMEVHEERISNLTQFMAAFDGSQADYQVGWIDATAKGDSLGQGIFEEGRLYDGLPKTLSPRRAKGIPFNAPGFMMNPLVVRWFNKVYFGSVPMSGRNRLRRLEEFFFPLDRVHNWNRLYGKKGFHQFQCVIPTEQAAATLKTMLTRIAASGLASPLAVLKKMGPGRAGMLSFPMEGYTLAVDFPENAKARALIGELETLALEASGRVYLAKDSLSSANAVQGMYGELADWRRIVNRADPHGDFETGLVRRLNLRGRA